MLFFGEFDKLICIVGPVCQKLIATKTFYETNSRNDVIYIIKNMKRIYTIY